MKEETPTTEWRLKAMLCIEGKQNMRTANDTFDRRKKTWDSGFN
jgi:hypothetical protein